MSPQQQRIAEAFNVRGYYHGMNGGSGIRGLGDDSRPITNAIGAGLLSAGGVIAAIPGGQLPGAIIAAVGALTELIGGLFAPDVTKIQATRIVDQIEAQVLKPLRASWQALTPAQKTTTMQVAYLEVYNSAMQNVQAGCSNPALGTAGQNCISDRLASSCHWTIDGQTPGIPPSNCGNWDVWYAAPIRNDPDVHPDPVAGAGSGSGGSSVVGSVDSAAAGVSQALGISPLAIGAILIGAALFLGGD